MDANDGKPILFFDGVCALCNGFADFVLARDKRGRFRIATLQGETAARARAAHPLPASGGDFAADALRSVLLLENGTLYRKSDAALRILEGLGGIWGLAGTLRLVPRGLRDAVYDFIARNRYRWFGRRAACRMPSGSERGRFLA
jgi:predicted DCC family thiol-disulfide oxidoreductase YuxK